MLDVLRRPHHRVLALPFVLALVVLLGITPQGSAPAEPAPVAATTVELSLMPARPELRERIRRGEVSLPEVVTNPELRRARGIDQPKGKAPARSSDAPIQAASEPSGTWNALALLVDFTDKPHQVGAAYFDSLLFPSDPSSFGTLRNYYRSVSYGKLDVYTVNLPSQIGWKTMPKSYSYYVGGDQGFGNYPANAQGLAEDAVRAADSAVDFSLYDPNQDGNVDALFIIHAGRGAEWSGSLNDIWSHSWVLSNPMVLDGKRVNQYTMEPEYMESANPPDMTVGVFAHELGHVLGLPDLYDTSYKSDGVGNWSLMAGGSWNGNKGSSPAFLDAWSRIQLGFVSPTVLGSNLTGASIPAAASNSSAASVHRLWTRGSVGSEYFLVENRQRTGYDEALPGSGLLVWHVDENQTNNDAPCYQQDNWRCGANHYKVALEQADGLFNLELGQGRGDTGDPYPGSTIDRNLTFTSSPNASSYSSSADTLVRVANISNSGSVMTADLKVAEAAAVPAPDLVVSVLSNPPASVTRGKTFTVNETTRNAGTAPASNSVTAFYLSSDRLLSADDILLGPTHLVGPLAAGASSGFAASVTVPGNAPRGSYYLIASADNGKVINESSESNNYTISTSRVKIR